jgi:hypothetical protein
VNLIFSCACDKNLPDVEKCHHTSGVRRVQFREHVVEQEDRSRRPVKAEHPVRSDTQRKRNRPLLTLARHRAGRSAVNNKCRIIPVRPGTRRPLIHVARSPIQKDLAQTIHSSPSSDGRSPIRCVVPRQRSGFTYQAVGLAEGGVQCFQHTKAVIKHRGAGHRNPFVPHLEGGNIGSPTLQFQQRVPLPDRPLVVLLVGACLRPELRSEIVEVFPTEARAAFDEVEVVRLKRNNRDLGQHISVALWSFPVHQHAPPAGPRQFDFDAGGSRFNDKLSSDDGSIRAIPDQGIIRCPAKGLQKAEVGRCLENARLAGPIASDEDVDTFCRLETQRFVATGVGEFKPGQVHHSPPGAPGRRIDRCFREADS